MVRAFCKRIANVGKIWQRRDLSCLRLQRWPHGLSGETEFRSTGTMVLTLALADVLGGV